MNKHFNWKLLVRLGVTLLALGIITWQLQRSHELHEIVIRINSIAWWPLLAAAGIFLVSLVFSTIQWQMLLNMQGIRFPVTLTWQFYLIGQFFSNFLPTNWGGDFVRIYDTGAYSENWERSTASIIVDRVLGLFALFLVGLVHAILFYWHYFNWIYLIAFTALMALGVLFFIFFDFKKLEGLIKSKNKVMAKISRFMDKFFLALASYQRDHRLLPVLGVAVVTQYLRILMNVFVAFSLGFSLAQIPFVNYFVVIPVVGLFSALPISINGIGVREFAGSILVNKMVGGSNLSVSVMFFLGYLVMTVVSLLGAVYFIQHQNRKRKKLKERI